MRILFCWARSHPEPGYRQGMHELLAPLYYVVQVNVRSTELCCYCGGQADCAEFSRLERQPGSRAELELTIGRDILVPDQLEADTWKLFESLMEVMEPWYSTGSSLHRYGTELSIVL